jgi:hypothetical protein
MTSNDLFRYSPGPGPDHDDDDDTEETDEGSEDESPGDHFKRPGVDVLGTFSGDFCRFTS